MAKKRKNRRKWLTRLLKVSIIGSLLIGIFILAVYIGVFGHLASPDEIKSIRNYLASEVYSSDDQLIGKYYVQNRTGADLDEIPEALIDALIATEDARFYEHNGVDGRSLFRVLFKTVLLFDKSSGGGSTITQQLVKNTYGRQDYGVLSIPVAKVKESILAQRFEEVFTKEQILELYLNTVSFGENIYGIETAAQRYFNVKPDQLGIEESAVLVGLLKGNTLYNPRRNPVLAEERRNTVLAQMEKYAYLTASEVDSLQAIPLEIDYYNLESDSPSPYFLAHIESEINDILEELKKPDGTAYDLRTDGLVVHTTLNARLQNYAMESMLIHMRQLQREFNTHWSNRAPWGNDLSLIKSEMKKTRQYQRLLANDWPEDSILKRMREPHTVLIADLLAEDGVRKVEMSSIDSIAYYQALLHCGFMAMDPKTGDVKAWIGGTNYQYIPYDHVTTRRQTASTFKPFVYGAGLEQGIDDCDYFRNITTTYTAFDNYTPTNSGVDDSLYYNLSGALKKSLNVVSVKVLFEAGMDSVKDFAQRAGLRSPIKKVPSMALGTNEATLLEMVNSYATFANRGMRVNPRYVTKIENTFGEVIYTAPNAKTERAFSQDVMDDLIEMMEGVINEGTAASARTVFGLKKEYAGKTGTAQNYSDGWFIGYSPQLVAGAWVGASSPKVHFRSGALGAGSHMALPIWARFFSRIENSRYASQYTGSFVHQSDTVPTIECPDVREPDLLERLENWFDDGVESDADTTEERSFWDKLFGLN